MRGTDEEREMPTEKDATMSKSAKHDKDGNPTIHIEFRYIKSFGSERRSLKRKCESKWDKVRGWMK